MQKFNNARPYSKEAKAEAIYRFITNPNQVLIETHFGELQESSNGFIICCGEIVYHYSADGVIPNGEAPSKVFKNCSSVSISNEKLFKTDDMKELIEEMTVQHELMTSVTNVIKDVYNLKLIPLTIFPKTKVKVREDDTGRYEDYTVSSVKWMNEESAETGFSEIKCIVTCRRKIPGREQKIKKIDIREFGDTLIPTNFFLSETSDKRLKDLISVTNLGLIRPVEFKENENQSLFVDGAFIYYKNENRVFVVGEMDDMQEKVSIYPETENAIKNTKMYKKMVSKLGTLCFLRKYIAPYNTVGCKVIKCK